MSKPIETQYWDSDACVMRPLGPPSEERSASETPTPRCDAQDRRNEVYRYGQEYRILARQLERELARLEAAYEALKTAALKAPVEGEPEWMPLAIAGHEKVDSGLTFSLARISDVIAVQAHYRDAWRALLAARDAEIQELHRQRGLAWNPIK